MQRHFKHFRMRPSLIAGVLSALLTTSAHSEDLSLLPLISPSSVNLFLEKNELFFCASTSGANTEFLKALAISEPRKADNPGFIPLDEFEIAEAHSPHNSESKSYSIPHLAEGPASHYSAEMPKLAQKVEKAEKGEKGEKIDKAERIDKPENSETSKSETPLKGYFASLTGDAIDKAKTLSSYIANKFNLEKSHADQTVAAAMVNSAKRGLPVSLVLAVIAVESSFNKDATYAGARGLMQIIPRWHKDKIDAIGGTGEMMKVDKNIAVGSAILKEYIDRYGGVFNGLYRYNASATAKEYTRKVLKQKSGFEAVMYSQP